MWERCSTARTVICTDIRTARHQIRRQGGITQIKIEELNPEQIGKARALATNEERLDYLKECGVELDEDILANVAGGKEINKKCKIAQWVNMYG